MAQGDRYGRVRWVPARVEHKFGAFIVEVEHGVEVAVAKENLAF
jgi:hypothetical protein